MAMVLQIDAYDPVASAAVTLRAASHDDDRVCNLNSQVWWPTITKLPALANDLFDGAFDSNSITDPTASLSLSYEPWANFARYTFGDARIQIWTGEPTDAWAAWVKRADARVSSQPKIQDWSADFDIQTDSKWLDTPLLTAYAGSGGIEGGTDLTGSFKPLALGVPQFVSGTLIDSVNSVFQISAYGAIQSIDVAFDKLVRFNAPVADYATYAALVAATIAPGAWATCLAYGLARFGAPPAGQVCFHVHGDVAGTDGLTRTPGKMIRRLALLSGGTGKVNDASLNALDTARPWNLSLDVTDQTTARDLIQSIAASVNSVAGVAWTGGLYVAPVGMGSPTVTLMADGSAIPQVSNVSQANMATPYWRLAIEAARTWTVHSLTDIASTVTFNPRGNYDAATVYRLGDIVTNPDGSKWQYISTTAAAGHAPPNATYWSAWDPNAQTALNQIAAIESDSVLSAGEKPDIIRQWTTATSEKAVFDSQADALAVSRTTYDNAYSALQTYLSGLSPAWNDTTQNTAIVAATFNGKFTDYYYARSALITALDQATAQSQGFVNKVPMSKFEKGVGVGWGVGIDQGGISTGQQSFAYNGKQIYKQNFTATAANQIISIISSRGGVARFPVKPSDRLFLGYELENSNCTVYAVVRYWDQAGANLGAQNTSGFLDVGGFQASWTPNQINRLLDQNGQFISPPANAVSAEIEWYGTTKASGTGFFSIAEPMLCSIPVAQTVPPAFAPGPNSLDGADPTSATWVALTGEDPGTTKANVTAATSLANGAQSTANIGAQLASDVADNNKFSSTEKKRWVEKINDLSNQVTTLYNQALALGLNTAASNMLTQWTALINYLGATSSGAATSNTPPPNYGDTAHTSAINSSTFKSYVANFGNALAGLSAAAQQYAQTTAVNAGFNMFTDSPLVNFIQNAQATGTSNWQQIASWVWEASSDGNRIRYSAGGSGDAVAMGPNVKCAPTDRIDIEMEYYCQGAVTGTPAFGIIVQVFNQSGTYLGAVACLLNAGTAVRDAWTKLAGHYFISGIGSNYTSAAFCRGYMVCNVPPAGSIYLRSPKAFKAPTSTQLLDGGIGRATTATIGSSNLVAGIKNASSGYVLSSAVSGSTATINIAACSYTFDTGATINYPTGSVTGCSFSTTYYVARVDTFLNGGTSYVASTVLTDVLKPGYVYLGYILTVSSGGSGGGGGGIGNTGCVGANMWVATSKGDKLAKDVQPGDLVMVLTADQRGWEWAAVLSNEPAENTVVTLRGSDTGAELDLAINTTMYADPPTKMDIAGNAWMHPLKTTTGIVIDEEPCEVSLFAMSAPVAKIDLGGRIYAAGREKGRYVFSHNPLAAKQ